MKVSTCISLLSALASCHGFGIPKSTTFKPSQPLQRTSKSASLQTTSRESLGKPLYSTLDEKETDKEELENLEEIIANSDIVKDNFEASLDDLKQMLQDDVLHDSKDFHLKIDDMGETVDEMLLHQKEVIRQQQGKDDGMEHVNAEIVDDKDWRKDMVSVEKEDPLMKWIDAYVSDSTMRIFSSEIGVNELVEKSIKPDRIPTSNSFPLDLMLSRSMDTVEDIAVHLARLPYEEGTAKLKPELESKRKTVVVLGSGWAAHALMKVADSAKLRLIVVSPANHFVFTPMLASSSVGTVEYRSMTEAVRSANPMIEDYLEGKATQVDVQNKKITVQLNDLLHNVREGSPPTVELDYDHLVVSVGCRIDDKGVPGADRALRLKTTDDAVKLRRAIGECLEYASRPDAAGPEHREERRKRATFLIVGGGPTGVELAGEILDLAADITRSHYGAYKKLKDDIRVILAHSGPDLVPQFEERLREEALKSLQKKGAEVYLNTRVNEVGDDFATLSTKQLDHETGEVLGRDEFNLDTGLSVWCAGTAPVDFVGQLLDQLPEEARNRDGRIKVDKWLRPTMPNKDLMGSVLVMGDAAAFPEGHDKITRDKLLPQTAQVAGQQGAYAARMLARGYDLTVSPPVLQCTDGSEKCDVYYDPLMIQWLQVRGITSAPQFDFLNLGILAYLGGGEALSQVQIGDFPLFSYFGSIAFVLWRSVYLVKQVATRNRVLVTFDWIKSAVFGRDITRF